MCSHPRHCSHPPPLPGESQQLLLQLRARSSGEAWRSVFTCSCPVQKRQVKRAQGACRRERTKKQGGLSGHRGLWAVSSVSCMPVIFLSCCYSPWLLWLLLQASPECGALVLRSPVPPLPPGALSFLPLAAVPRESILHWALFWAPEDPVGQFFPSRSHAHTVSQEQCHWVRQKVRSLREYSATIPTDPSKKHLCLPNLTSLLSPAQVHGRHLPSLVLVELGWPEPRHRLQSVGAELRAGYENRGLRQLASKNRTAATPPAAPPPHPLPPCTPRRADTCCCVYHRHTGLETSVCASGAHVSL